MTQLDKTLNLLNELLGTTNTQEQGWILLLQYFINMALGNKDDGTSLLNNIL